MNQFIDLEHYRFRYIQHGQPHNPAVLFLHGFMGDADEFNDMMACLSDQFYCIAVDLPGHGKTTVAEADQYYTMPNIANGLISFLDTLKIRSCCLIGYSMGGRLALYLALHFPNYFSQVVLESASPGLKTQAEREQRLKNDFKLAQRLETEAFSSFLSQWYSQPLFASLQQHPHFEQMLKHRLQNNRPAQLSKALRNLSTGCQPSLWQKLAQNEVPMLLLVGELDRKFVDINTEIAKFCPFTTLEVVSHCGHNIHLENTALFIQYIRRFIASVNASANTTDNTSVNDSIGQQHNKE